MKKFLITIFALVILMSIPNLAHAQLWSGILPAGSGIDWTQTGIPGGVPTTRTQCGSTISAPSSASAIQTALNACPSNTYLLLGAGTFSISSTINVPANETLRGSGANLTILNVTGSGQAPITLGTGGVSYSGVNITSGATAGSTSIVVSSASGITVGSYLVVSELNDTANLVTNQGGEGACTWCDGWSTNGARARGQIVEVTSVTGTTIGIAPGLYSAYTLTPTVVPFAASEKYAGVENLQVYMNNSGWTDAFFMTRCAYCWIKGAEVNYADGDYIEDDWGYRDEIRDSYFSNSFHHTPGTFDGDIFLIYKTTASKVENNIIERAHASIMLARGTAGNVYAYNYVTGAFDSGGIPNYTMASLQSHGAHPQFNLLEGNVVPKYGPDQVWGSASNNTLFRNWIVGTSYICTPVADTRSTVTAPCHYSYQVARAMEISHLSLYNNLVGDIVGSAQMQGLGITNTASVAYPATRQYDTVAYGYTWGYGESSDDGSGTGCGGGTPPCHGTEALSTSFLHGEYNNISSAITWASGVTQTLPASFYLAAKPAWWGSLTYPAIGPDVTGGSGPGGHVNLIPAQNCYLNVMGGSDGGVGSPLVFNASACYAAASPSPAPPTDLKVWNVQ